MKLSSSCAPMRAVTISIARESLARSQIQFHARPIFGAKSYINRLRQDNGCRIRCLRVRSIYDPASKRPVEEYEIADKTGQPLVKLYISPYHKFNSVIAPCGFTLRNYEWSAHYEYAEYLALGSRCRRIYHGCRICRLAVPARAVEARVRGREINLMLMRRSPPFPGMRSMRGRGRRAAIAALTAFG